MGWNGSGADARELTQFPKTSQKRSRQLPIALILTVAAVVAMIIWLMLVSREEGKADEPVRRNGIIAETVPTTAGQASGAMGRFRDRRPMTRQVATASVGTLPNLPLVTNRPPRVYGEINGKSLFPRPLFKTREENHIAGLLTAEPGARCLLSGFMPGEEERYLKSLDEPVMFEEVDTPDERATKEFMIEVKKELKERVAAGEKITDIVQELRDERNEYAKLKDKLTQQFALLQNEGSVEEIMQFYEEANGILAEYGMQPLALRSNKKELYRTYIERKRQSGATSGANVSPK